MHYDQRSPEENMFYWCERMGIDTFEIDEDILLRANEMNFQMNDEHEGSAKTKWISNHPNIAGYVGQEATNRRLHTYASMYVETRPYYIEGEKTDDGIDIVIRGIPLDIKTSSVVNDSWYKGTHVWVYDHHEVKEEKGYIFTRVQLDESKWDYGRAYILGCISTQRFWDNCTKKTSKRGNTSHRMTVGDLVPIKPFVMGSSYKTIKEL